MTYEEMVKLNIDTKLTKVDLVDMIADEMQTDLENEQQRINEALEASKERKESGSKAFTDGVLKTLKIKAKTIETHYYDSEEFPFTAAHKKHLEKLKEEFNALVETLEPGKDGAIRNHRYNYQLNNSYSVNSATMLQISYKKPEKMIAGLKLKGVEDLRITLTKEMIQAEADRMEPLSYEQYVLRYQKAMVEIKLKNLNRVAGKIKNQITRKILESTEEGHKVLKMLDGVAKKVTTGKAAIAAK